MMWMLLIVFVHLQEPDHTLATFPTFDACQLERNRIGFAMAEAYPYEADFRIECQPKVSMRRIR